MRLINKEKDRVILALTAKELSIIRLSIGEVLDAIETWEIPVRVGVTAVEAKAFWSRLGEVISRANGRTQIELQVSASELLIANNALNEICNGIDIPEFEARIGAPVDDARNLLSEVHALV
jgi:hypothetical protein